jgi:hypothetical protein
VTAIIADYPNIETIGVAAPNCPRFAVAAAIAVHHTTGTRLRELPVRLDKLIL